MQLIDQHTKKIMEGCKERARDAGLRFQDETLEYIVTNKDLLELTPKYMIPTLYDYWVHDVDVLRERGRYELYPVNPYETVINTRPPISFYNDNNPDWLNVMIFYHVLAHIDFFQNNMLFKHTWHEDFTGIALADKRLIARLRSEKGRWVDYVIEFTRGIDNIIGYYEQLSDLNHPKAIATSRKVNYYFDHFLQTVHHAKTHEYFKEIDRYNEAQRRYGAAAESIFFSEVSQKYPEFDTLFLRSRSQRRQETRDVIQYLIEHSPFLQREENKWMRSLMQVVRNTSLFFQPQIRTKILNEGWASYWHEKLFLGDDRIRGNEVAFALVNANVIAIPRIGLNPYGLGVRLLSYLEELAETGKTSFEFQKLTRNEDRASFNRKTGKGKDFLFSVRENYSDFLFINSFVDQDFVDRHNLFVAGKRLNAAKGVWEIYVKSRDAHQYKEMLIDSLYHPPYIYIDPAKARGYCLYLNHRFEGKPLVQDYIANTMLGIEYLWGGPVKLETTELHSDWQAHKLPRGPAQPYTPSAGRSTTAPPRLQRVVYTMENRRLRRALI